MVHIEINTGDSPIVTAAIHNGHQIRPELLPYLNLNETERLREEDPFTTEWLHISDNTIKVHNSRFEVDVNRPREKAVYSKPKDSWGLQVWKEDVPAELIEKSLNVYDNFYRQLADHLDQLLLKHPWLVVYDFHSYNFRREGVDRYASPEENPEINIGTQNMNRKQWAAVVDTLIQSFREYNFEGRHLDVRENVKFKGGYFSKWINDHYGDRVCVLPVEVKKFFMNEWTGEANQDQLKHLRELFISSMLPVREAAEEIFKVKA
ncbi:N-formylglutamate deformylase [Catalinimonas alkaloidigena]|uniref:N-formylglutamate amidohydrolase n=1 Tax=Catalinimonas alkaloidigena TaxID=1075417 RepID=UPI00240510FD|nr:N-formylglutamate amidohydrolase [Catalinimonas alkaloidigena]MDF9798211.1 N-formylglutamate deformylase [Catalinimonas alkaloidigena]